VEVLTNLAITGKPAQFGEEVIADVSEKLLDQFVDCISGRFAESLSEAQAISAESGVAAAAAAIDQADGFAGLDEAGAATGFDEVDTEQTIELEAVAAGEAAATGSAPNLGAPGPVAASTQAQPTASESVSSTAREASEPPRDTAPPRRTGESTLDVLRTVVPVLVKRYGPVLAIFGLLLFIVIKIIRRKS
jgi:uncharacterized protein